MIAHNDQLRVLRDTQHHVHGFSGDHAQQAGYAGMASRASGEFATDNAAIEVGRGVRAGFHHPAHLGHLALGNGTTSTSAARLAANA